MAFERFPLLSEGLLTQFDLSEVAYVNVYFYLIVRSIYCFIVVHLQETLLLRGHKLGNRRLLWQEHVISVCCLQSRANSSSLQVNSAFDQCVVVMP